VTGPTGILNSVLDLAPILHSAGTCSPSVLKALERHAAKRGVIGRSIETGCGATTLLLSHLSENHTVFALDAGTGSVTNVRLSPLLRRETVTFVEAPSQISLPQFPFPGPLQLALLDGPHAYPFPELEYYFTYPHLDTGALLVIDDIQIPTINNLFQFLRRDAMFQLDEVVRSTAFFSRTNAPTFDPLGDGWQLQGYNAKPLARYDWPGRIGALLPRPWLRRMFRHLSRPTRPSGQCHLAISAPREGEQVNASATVTGSATLPPGAHLWLLVHRKDIDAWWLQSNRPVDVVDGLWTAPAGFGEPVDAGHQFEILAIVVDESVGRFWSQCASQSAGQSTALPGRLPAGPSTLAEAYRTVTRR
jgi:hypothetical protein